MIKIQIFYLITLKTRPICPSEFSDRPRIRLWLTIERVHKLYLILSDVTTK